MSRNLKYLAQDTQNIKLLLAICHDYCELGQFEEALGFVEQALHLVKTKAQAGQLYGLQAELYFDANQLAFAERAAKQALQLAPNNYPAQVILVLLGLEEGTTTTSEIKQLIKREPTDARLWFSLGTTYFRELKFQQAEKAHLKVTALKPDFYENWLSLASSQLFLDKLTEAKMNYERAITLYAERAEAWGGLALANALNQELSEAKYLIEKAKAFDSDCSLAAIAELICANHQEPSKTPAQFNRCFPKASQQLTEAITYFFREFDKT